EGVERHGHGNDQELHPGHVGVVEYLAWIRVHGVPPQASVANRFSRRCSQSCKLFETTSNTSGDKSGSAWIRNNSAFIRACRSAANLRQRVSGVSWRAAICGLLRLRRITSSARKR